jgi:hypothetical protein
MNSAEFAATVIPLHFGRKAAKPRGIANSLEVYQGYDLSISASGDPCSCFPP